MTQSLSFHRCVKTSWSDESQVSIMLMNLRSGVWLSEKEWLQACVEASVESGSCGMWAITSCLRSLWGHMEGKCYEAFRRPEGLNMASPLLSTPGRPSLSSLSHHDISLKPCTPSSLPRRSTDTGKHGQKLEQSGVRKTRATLFSCGL